MVFGVQEGSGDCKGSEALANNTRKKSLTKLSQGSDLRRRGFSLKLSFRI